MAHQKANEKTNYAFSFSYNLSLISDKELLKVNFLLYFGSFNCHANILTLEL